MKTAQTAPARSRTRLMIGSVLALALLALPDGSLADDPFLRRTAAVRVVERVGPAVVNIRTEHVLVQRNPFGQNLAMPPSADWFRRYYEGQARPRTVQNLGSGVIIDAEGHVLTNEHVIGRASKIFVILSDGREFEATLIGADTNNDLAVLNVATEEDLPWVAPGSSSDLMIGEPVIAIGNPFGLSNSVTTGVISATDRSLEVGNRVYHSFLQTDASINPGNSGGPLLNAEGSLIGINSVTNAGADGIGFAIPIDVAKRVASELIQFGEIQPVWLGLQFQQLDPALQEVMDLPDGVSGALINNVAAKSPASRAGLKRGDIVLEVDGHAVHTAMGFFKTLETAVDKQILKLLVWRNGEKLELAVLAEQIPQKQIEQLARSLLGLDLKIHERGGYEVMKVVRGTPAARVPLRKTDVVIGINGRALRDSDDLRRALVDLRGQEVAYLVVVREGRRYPVKLPLG